MRVSARGRIFDIEDKYAEYSPLLSAMMQSSVPVDTDVYGNVSIDADPSWFEEYVNFLKGKPFRFYGGIVSLFDYMGHINHMKYPATTWGMKLRDNWIRDNFYRLELWKDPLYGLQNLPMVRDLPIKIPKGWYVAGGAALWMAGKIDKLADIDLFTSMSKEEAMESLQFLNENWTAETKKKHLPMLYRAEVNIYGAPILGKRYEVRVTENSITYTELVERKNSSAVDKYKVQLILRLYKSPSETVHGFDLDCVGAVYVPYETPTQQGIIYNQDQSIYCTQRTLFSLSKRTNWFDPTRVSPSYAYRLIKYKSRGFNIYLPLATWENVNKEEVDRYFSYIRDVYRDTLDEVDDEIYKSDISSIPIYQIFLRVKSHINIVDDPASLLILATFCDLYVLPRGTPPSDYEQNATSSQLAEQGYIRGIPIDPRIKRYNKEFRVNPSLLNWKEQNPMEQVSSTFYPTPIQDIREWYKTSRFYGQDKPSTTYM